MKFITLTVAGIKSRFNVSQIVYYTSTGTGSTVVTSENVARVVSESPTLIDQKIALAGGGVTP